METWNLINKLLENLNKDIAKEDINKNYFNCLRDTIDKLEDLKRFY